MVRRLLVSGLLDREQEKTLRHRWLNDSIAGFLLSLRAGRLRDVIFYLTHGIEINPSWPIKLLVKKAIAR
jgi:hypothetical protein